jgi:ABC-2 type transport system permease protein
VSSASAALPVRGASNARGAPGAAAAWALVRRALRDARTRTLSFAYLFAIYGYVQAQGYRNSYPTVADRLVFAHSFGSNEALRLFYGYPYELVSIGGYSAWRVGGTLAIAAAVFGVFASVRAMRTEEDAGRMELVLAGGVTRASAYVSALVAIALCVLGIWSFELVGLLLGGLPAGQSAYLALATVSVIPVFAGVGAVSSQLAPTRRLALELGTAAVGLFLLLRVIADTATGAGWLRWATPLGWAELMRPFAGSQPLVLLAPVLAGALLLALAGRIAVARDVGTGLLRPSESAPPNLRLLSSPLAQGLRGERASLLVWGASVGAFALVLGNVSSSISAAGVSKHLREEIARLGSGSIFTPLGYLSFVFVVFMFAISLFACAQIAAVRREEAGEQLQTLLALPVSRGRWLGGRLALAALASAGLALAAALFAWIGAVSQGVDVTLPRLLAAGANCLPIALLFLGLAVLTYALAPRAGVGIAYGLVVIAFLWNLVGSVLGAPKVLVELTPFAHVGYVPTQPFRLGAAAVMVGLAAACGAGALAAFRRRDLIGE